MFMLNFANANFSSEEWCYENNVSYGIMFHEWSKFRGGGEALPNLAYTGQVCATEQKVLSIKQSVEFYYCSSKIPIIYFITLIVKYPILIVNSLQSVVNSAFFCWKP